MALFGLAAGRFDIYNKDFTSYYLVISFQRVTIDPSFREQCVKFDPDRLYLLVISGKDPNIKLLLLEIMKQLTSR